MRTENTLQSFLRICSSLRPDLSWMSKRSALAAGIFLPFCVITFWNFNLPGLHFDEAVKERGGLA